MLPRTKHSEKKNPVSYSCEMQKDFQFINFSRVISLLLQQNEGTVREPGEHVC